MEQKPSGDSSGDIKRQPEIIPAPAAGNTAPAPNKFCPNCGTASSPDSVYCHKCGLKLPDTTTLGKKICAGCHTPNDPAAQYCYKCGLPLPEKLGSGYENQIHYAGFWIRFVAYLIDGIFLYIVNSVIIGIFIVSVYGTDYSSKLLSSLQSSGTMSESQISSFIGVILLAYLVGGVVSVAYYTVSIGKWGRTLGKAALKIKVVKPDGSRVSYWRALVRNLAYYLNGFTLDLSFLIIAFTKQKRGLHDYIADTIVIKTG